MQSGLSSLLHTSVATLIFLSITVLLWLVTHVHVNAQENGPLTDTSNETRSFSEILEQVQNGNKWERELAAAELADYPERVNEFAQPLAEYFLAGDAAMDRIAQRVFRYLGESAVPALDEMFLDDKDSTPEINKLWRETCGAINAIGDPARKKWESRLLEVIEESDNVFVRVPAVYGLNGFSDGCAAAIPKVLGDLSDENFNVTLAVLRLIIKTGPQAGVAVPELRRLLEEGNLSQRTYAAWALGAIGPTDEYDPLPELKTMLEQYALVERDRALTAVGLLGEHAAELEPRVREMMTTPNTNLEARAAYVLWQITGDNSDAVPRLVELAQTLDHELSALDYLRQMGPAARAATGFLLERSQAEDYSIKVAVLDALCAIDPESGDVQARVNELLEDPHPVVRLAAKMASNCSEMK